MLTQLPNARAVVCSRPTSCRICIISCLLVSAATVAPGPMWLDEQFELPDKFHIYRAAGPDLSGGSYALTFDGDGRLLVGDGNAVRRLVDQDGDGQYDDFEVLATGLGWRGPQGLLVFGDRLYAVGGDGLQCFEGYESDGPLTHGGRLGNPLNTGGDHTAHTVLRGWDNHLYLVTGDGGGIGDRSHITEDSSPVLFARHASVFRISADGGRWECLSTGGRNPPNLGLNHLGEFFSLDSDMEWHVALPWYRPVRLNHWLMGGDQGWEPVGAYPPYFLDALPGVLDVGRGSPDWGIFYEHNQFPDRYRGDFFVCDYRWKSESGGEYNSAGRLLCFSIKRQGAEWTAEMEIFARPRPGARDADGQPILFALVDAAVAPDGSLFITDHNQGVWRIVYGDVSADAPLSARQPESEPLPEDSPRLLEELLTLPQPGSEWARKREEALRTKLGPDADDQLRQVATSDQQPLKLRLRAIRLLAPGFAELESSFLQRLAGDSVPEIRAQAAWLLSIQRQDRCVPVLLKLLKDRDPFVRRRAAEGLTRYDSPDAIEPLLIHLGDPSRLTRFACMTALAHQPSERWLRKGAWSTDPQTRMRVLVAALMRREPPDGDFLRQVIESLLVQVSPQEAREERLDFLRILGLYQEQIEARDWLRAAVTRYLLDDFPSTDTDIRWEQVRLLGSYRIADSFPALFELLLNETDGVAQFHIVQALARLPHGWTEEQERRMWNWLLSTQRGWFASFDDKGHQFPEFWSTVLAEFARHHQGIMLERVADVRLESLLGAVVIDLVSDLSDGSDILLRLYRKTETQAARQRIVRALGRDANPAVAAFLRSELEQPQNPELRHALLLALSRQDPAPANIPWLVEAIGSTDLDLFVSCARSLSRHQIDLTPELARVLITRMAESPRGFHAAEQALTALAGVVRPGSEPDIEEDERPAPATRRAGADFWSDWFSVRFGSTLHLPPVPAQFTDEALRDFLLSDDVFEGDPAGGKALFEQLECQKCHGGIDGTAREVLFGPDLVGVTQRLSREEWVEAIVFPSQRISERFQAMELELKDGRVLTGFVTAADDNELSFVDRDRVYRIAQEQIQALAPQKTSLMPEGLLNGLSRRQIRDLVAFLKALDGQAPVPSTVDP